MWPGHGRRYSHLVSDVSYAELQVVAERAGLPARAFDGDHYDVPAERHDDLVAAGAVPTSGADLVRRLNASGLRLRKRKGDRGLARLFNQRTPFGPATIDVVGSARPVAGATISAELIAEPSGGSDWGVPWTPLGAAALPAPVGVLSGYLRVSTAEATRLVQVWSVPGASPVPGLPWCLFG